MARTVMDAVDIETGDKIYFNGHAQATFMADGSTVEDNIQNAKSKLNQLNVFAVDAVDSGDGIEYVTSFEFDSKMNEIMNILDEINGLFTFYIGDIEFKASQNMTWGDWIESKYNTEKFESEYIESLYGVKSLNDLIEKGETYMILTNGVYVVDVNGKLHDGETFDGTTDQVTGIGLVTDKVKMIVALDEWYSNSSSNAWNGNKRSAWGGYNKIVTGCFIGSSGYLNDFNGEANTDAIIAQLQGTTDGNSQYYTGAPAAEYCRAYSNGYKGVGEWYLPAAGELNEIVLNKDAINDILTKLGKNSLSKNNYTWSSSQSYSGDAWFYHWNYSLWSYCSKDVDEGVRPICKL